MRHAGRQRSPVRADTKTLLPAFAPRQLLRARSLDNGKHRAEAKALRHRTLLLPIFQRATRYAQLVRSFLLGEVVLLPPRDERLRKLVVRHGCEFPQVAESGQASAL